MSYWNNRFLQASETLEIMLDRCLSKHVFPYFHKSDGEENVRDLKCSHCAFADDRAE